MQQQPDQQEGPEQRCAGFTPFGGRLSQRAHPYRSSAATALQVQQEPAAPDSRSVAQRARALFVPRLAGIVSVRDVAAGGLSVGRAGPRTSALRDARKTAGATVALAHSR